MKQFNYFKIVIFQLILIVFNILILHNLLLIDLKRSQLTIDIVNNGHGHWLTWIEPYAKQANMVSPTLLLVVWVLVDSWW